MLYYIYRLCLRLQKEPAVKFPMHKLHKCISYSIARKEVSMYRNFIFDLYGTLVDIHTNEYKPSLWKKMALFYSFQGAAYTGKELRCRYRQLETAARKAPSPYAYPEICAADIFRILFDRYGLNPADCLMIGNERTSDLAGAVAAGIDCCYLHTATSSGSAGDTPEEARFTVMDGDSYSLQKLLLTLTG